MASVALPAVGALAPVAVLQVDAGRAVQTRRRLTFIHIFKKKKNTNGLLAFSLFPRYYDNFFRRRRWKKKERIA